MAATTTVSPTAIDDLAAAYAFREPAEVFRFLNAHPDLVHLLAEARPVIARHFPPETPVALELVVDRETGDDEDTELFALIQTDLPPHEARPRLDRFTQQWWLRVYRRAHGRLEFNLWFV